MCLLVVLNNSNSASRRRRRRRLGIRVSHTSDIYILKLITNLINAMIIRINIVANMNR